MTPLTFKSANIRVHRATYTDSTGRAKAGILIMQFDNELTIIGRWFFCTKGPVHWMVLPDNAPGLSMGDEIHEFASFTGEVRRGYAELPTPDAAGHLVPCILLRVLSGSVFCCYPKGDLRWLRVIAAQARDGDAPKAAKPKRKDLLKQLARTQEALDDARKRNAELGREAEYLAQLAAERLDSIAVLQNQLRNARTAVRNELLTALDKLKEN